MLFVGFFAFPFPKVLRFYGLLGGCPQLLKLTVGGSFAGVSSAQLGGIQHSYSPARPYQWHPCLFYPGQKKKPGPTLANGTGLLKRRHFRATCLKYYSSALQSTGICPCRYTLFFLRRVCNFLHSLRHFFDIFLRGGLGIHTYFCCIAESTTLQYSHGFDHF